MTNKPTITRSQKNADNPYAMILKAALRDKRLSWKARGILAYCLTNSDTWKIYLSELEKHSEKDGRDSTGNGFKELIELGYVIKTRKHGARGRFKGYEYEIIERPLAVNGLSVNGKPTVNGLSVNGLSVNGKPATNNNKKVIIKNSNKKERAQKNENIFFADDSPQDLKGETEVTAEATKKKKRKKELGRALILNPDHMEQAGNKTLAWVSKRKPNLSPTEVQEVGNLMIVYARKFAKYPRVVEPHIWALYESVEFLSYWEDKLWKNKSRRLVASIAGTIATRFGQRLEGGTYYKPCPDSPNASAKPWEIAQANPVARVAPPIAVHPVNKY